MLAAIENWMTELLFWQLTIFALLPGSSDTNTFALNANPNSSYATLYRGIAYLEKQQYALAIEDFDRTIALNPVNNWQAFPNRVLAKVKLGQYDKAVADYTRAIELNPNDHLLPMVRGYCFAKLGDLENAIKDYNKSLYLNPDHCPSPSTVLISKP